MMPAPVYISEYREMRVKDLPVVWEEKMLGRRFFVLAAVVGLCSLHGCADKLIQLRYAQVAAYDINLVPVSEFTFEQDAGSGEISLKIRNVYHSAVSFSYLIEFDSDDADWKSQGFVTNLLPEEEIDKGVVQINPARIDLGAFLITFTSLEDD